ncbi:hypothetical protein OTK49_03215 [Vibrio coralliirubri]|uniref:hypothetical protein n=1 Tax=Vibrio coralliirubri TaxID=1516159 RepID=UPI0022838BB8|nr:hypothetical protein [Vibrio coralliirubri]MCY9861526.1 hypothetical protein [Vibrio coralliirubri]
MELLGFSISILLLIPLALMIDVINKTKTSFCITSFFIIAVTYISIVGIKVSGNDPDATVQLSVYTAAIKKNTNDVLVKLGFIAETEKKHD